MIVSPTAEMEHVGGERYVSTIHLKPIAFVRNGNYRRIQNLLSNSGDQNFPLGTDELMQFRIKPRLAGNSPLIHIGHGGEHVRITPIGTNNVDGVVSGQSITYPEAWNNADLRITIAGHIVKKEIILRSGHPASFAFRMDERTITNKLIEHEPFLSKDDLHIPLTWVRSTQGGKQILTAVLPTGDWAGWVLDPTYTSQPDETSGVDSHINGSATTTNYGTSGDVRMGRNDSAGPDVHREVIKFDYSTIPSSILVNSANLSQTISTDRSGNTRNYKFYRILRDWVESQVTWNIWKTSNNWTTAGCGSAGNDYDSTVLATLSLTATESGVKTWSFDTTITKGMIDGTYPNYGYLGKADTEVDDCWIFYSSSDGTSSNRPKMVIDYTVVALTGFFFGAF